MSQRRQWTSEEVEALRRLVASGQDDISIAAALTRRFGRPITRASVDSISRRCGFHRSLAVAAPRAPSPPEARQSRSTLDEQDPPTLRSARGPIVGVEPDPDIPIDIEDMPGESGDADTPAPMAQRGPGVRKATVISAPPDPVEVRQKRDETTGLRRQIDDLVKRLRDANARQGFLDAAAPLHHEPPRIYTREKSSGIREMTPVVLASDWHVEEPVDGAAVAYRNEYNLEIASRRIERFFQAIIWNVEHHRASGRIAIHDLVLWLGGDMYSGYIHPELVEGNLLSPAESVVWLLPRLRDGIATLLDHLGLAHLEIPCSHGNHGRTTIKSMTSTGYANSFDYLLYHALAEGFRGDSRVHFEITPSNHQYVQVYDQTIHFHHGDEVKYQGGIGGLGIPLLKAVPMWDRVKPADVHCIGHWHQLRDYGRAVVNGSLIGYNPYAQKIRAEFEEPMQAMFYMDKTRGKSMLTSLWVEESRGA